MSFSCRVCGQPEDLAAPFIDGTCADCLRKASGVEPARKKPKPAKTPALPKNDPLSNSVMEALGIDDVPRQAIIEPAPSRPAAVPFRPRDYPALRTISRVYRIAAILVGIAFCIAEFVLILGFVAQLSSELPVDRFLPSFLISQLIVVSACGSAILTFFAIAEAIRLGLDIQNNTHAAAHFSEQTAQLSRVV